MQLQLAPLCLFFLIQVRSRAVSEPLPSCVGPAAPVSPNCPYRSVDHGWRFIPFKTLFGIKLIFAQVFSLPISCSARTEETHLSTDQRRPATSRRTFDTRRFQKSKTTWPLPFDFKRVGPYVIISSRYVRDIVQKTLKTLETREQLCFKCKCILVSIYFGNTRDYPHAKANYIPYLICHLNLLETDLHSGIFKTTQHQRWLQTFANFDSSATIRAENVKKFKC